MGNLNAIFYKNSFALITETSKAIEYENRNNREIVYLLHNVGISIVLNPNTIEKNPMLTSGKKYHNSALKKFPTRVNNGKKPIHYGYSFKFKQESELDYFLNNLNP
jgi:hypothetical protein